MEAVGDGVVFAYAADVSCVLPYRMDGNGIEIVLGFVQHQYAGSLAQKIFRRLSAELLFGLDIHRLRMAAKDRHPHRGRSNRQVRFTEDLAGLVDHLQLFFGITAVGKDIDVRDAVKSNLMGKLLLAQLTAVEQRRYLLTQL